MGRNRNKANRSSHRGNNANTASAASIKDSGLPAFFRHRQFAKLPKANGTAEAKDEGDARMDVEQDGDATRHDMEAEMGGAETGAITLGSLDASLVNLGQAPSTAHDATQDLSVASAQSTSSSNRSAALDAFERKALDPTLSGKRDNSMRAFMKEMRKVLELADVLLEVLDARDPMGCRSLATERLALSQGKRVILILNKIDLVPRSNVEAWLRYLRHDFPTLAFKSSTQQQRSNLAQGRGEVPGGGGPSSSKAATTTNGGASSTSVMGGGSEALGANALLQLLKNYSRSSRTSLKTTLHVGVFGTPNVGKSSLINSLKRARVCGVASTPGHTKVVQTVALDRGIRLLDCPGIVFLDGGAEGRRGDGEEEQAWQALRNTVKVELIDDPIKPVQAIINRVPSSQLTSLYNITGGFDEGDVQDFLLRLALLKGKLGRGGIPDLDGTARIVLHDWNVGRINYWTEPPLFHRSAGAGGNLVIGAIKGKAKVEREARPAASSRPAADGQMEADETMATAGLDAAAAATAALPQVAPTEVAGASIVSHFSEAFDLAALLGEADAEALGAGDGSVNPEKPSLVLPSTSKDSGSIVVDEEGSALPGVEQGSSKAGITKARIKKPRSSLGKRRRGMDDDDDESSDEDDDDEDDDDAHLPIARDDDDENANEGLEVVDGAEEPAWLQRQRAKASSKRGSGSGGGAISSTNPLPAGSARKAELSRMFGEEELHSLAAPRGGGRKKARKDKRRRDREGQLVFELEMGLDIDAGEGGEDGERMQEGITSVERNGSQTRTGAKPNLFSALAGANEDEELNDDEEEATIPKQKLPESILNARPEEEEEEEEEEL